MFALIILTMIFVAQQNISPILSSPRRQLLVLWVTQPLLFQRMIVTANTPFTSAFLAVRPMRRRIRNTAQRKSDQFFSVLSLSHSSSSIHTTSSNSASTTTSIQSTSSDNNRQLQNLREQRKKDYMAKVQDFKGVTKSYISSSQYVTHFLAPGNDTDSDSCNVNGVVDVKDRLTIEQAIELVLPSPIPNMRKRRNAEQIEMSLWTKELIIREKNNPILQSIEAKFRHDPALLGDWLPQTNRDDNHSKCNDEKEEMREKDQLSPAELIALGSVWFLPSDAPTDPSLGTKPMRVELRDLQKTLKRGDYLRIHHSPKRFPTLHYYDWGKKYQASTRSGVDNNESNNSGVIVKEDEETGYIIVNKPCGVPVHPTVDNVLENVAGAIGRSLLKRNSDSILEEFDELRTIGTGKRKKTINALVYVATPQRLDQNTSGLVAVATKKSFASYFAALLRKKTDTLLKNESNITDNVRNNSIQKKYRCLVCINANSGSKSSPVSMWDEVYRLKKLAQNQILRHFLDPVEKCPRIYSSTQDTNSTWLECLMRISNVGTPFPLLGSDSSTKLSTQLWGSVDLVPRGCVAVVEVEIELLTGRTHQIRGQLAAMGFPLCNDQMYGGSQITTDRGYHSDFLCLQCCELSFRDPLIENQQNNFRLEHAWWSVWLDEYTESVNKGVLATTGVFDESTKVKAILNENRGNYIKTKVMPSKIQLCPGKNKYVIIKASKPGGAEPEWFVRSSSPNECGGLYHADVAKILLEQLTEMGFRVKVLGGGRIDYCDKNNHAHVYGYSYGFGKGDHEFVSLLIEKYTKISVSFDNSDVLY